MNNYNNQPPQNPGFYNQQPGYYPPPQGYPQGSYQPQPQVIYQPQPPPQQQNDRCCLYVLLGLCCGCCVGEVCCD
ncbi:unnamed protein product [Auanema sp. JU1783]|nr:unnamed protein product [Auanema sp. JU1783]